MIWNGPVKHTPSHRKLALLTTRSISVRPHWRTGAGCAKITTNSCLYVIRFHHDGCWYNYLSILLSHRLLYEWIEHWRWVYRCQHHNEPQTPYKIKVNNCKLINLVIRIELTRSIWMPRFSNFLTNSAIYFRMFFYLVACFLRVRFRLPSLIR